MLISWEGTPTQIRMRVGSITLHACLCVCGWVAGAGAGAWWVNMSSVCQNPEIFICILYLVTICSDSASYFLEMSILIILVGTLTQIRMGLGCITFPGIGLRRGQYAFLMSKSRMLIHFQPLIIVLSFQPLIFLKWLCLLDSRYPDSNKNADR